MFLNTLFSEDHLLQDEFQHSPTDMTDFICYFRPRKLIFPTPIIGSGAKTETNEIVELSKVRLSR